MLRYPQMDAFNVQALEWQRTLERLCGLSPQWALQSLQTDAGGRLVFVAFDPATNITALLRNSFYAWSNCQQFTDFPGTQLSLSPTVANDFAAVRTDQNYQLQALLYRSASNVFLTYPLQLRGYALTGFAANAGRLVLDHRVPELCLDLPPRGLRPPVLRQPHLRAADGVALHPAVRHQHPQLRPRLPGGQTGRELRVRAAEAGHQPQL